MPPLQRRDHVRVALERRRDVCAPHRAQRALATFKTAEAKFHRAQVALAEMISNINALAEIQQRTGMDRPTVIT